MAQDTGLIVSWFRSPGDAVKSGDALFEVETDKATMEVEAPADGYLTDVQADAGAEVPVGNVIALISDTAEDSGTLTKAAPADTPSEPPAEAPAQGTTLPEGAEVIMPALGMAQDTGLIVAWHKSPGDAVASGDMLFEVETDKSTMEVEAGHDGFVAALLAEAGEEAPVGDVIAIISTDKPGAPVQRSIAEAASPKAAAPRPARDGDAKPASADKAPAPANAAAPPEPAPGAKPRADGRILASPKARRLALEQGLDLGRLVEAGHPQPYHAEDIEVLKALPSEASQSTTAVSRRLTADLPHDGVAAFKAWASETAGLEDENALLAGLAAASLGRDSAMVAVESFGARRGYTVPAGPLGAITATDEDIVPDLILRDLRLSRITSVSLGAEDAPVLTLTPAGDGLSITLECASHHLTATEAVSLLSEFAGRMEHPLRHLL
ncbi:biotin/lipoyl-containing protein [Roseovarius salinarum]|uniref:biotin/lipoyl-containing protein n=1 Tax=Roseovarius salinarum TaxID=1981892 RepID=UPI001E291E23|nr:biotin/lipoyl-containing protein [Roseovarius salinarum]